MTAQVLNQQTAFFISLAIGSGSLFAGSFYGLREESIGLSLAIMLIYGISVYISIKRNERDIEELADSFYYLGFMFTLTALVSSIPNFGHAPLESRTDNITRMFALGLCTTIVGLGGKLLFSQFKKTGPRSVEEAQEILTRSISTLALQVEETARHVRSSRQQASEEIEGLANSIKQNFEGSIDGVTQGINHTSNTLLTAMAQVIQDQNKHLSQHQDLVASSLRELKQEADSLKDGIKKVSSYAKKQADLLDVALTESATSVDAFKEAARSGKRFASQLAAIETQLSQLGSNLVALQDEHKSLLQVLRDQNSTSNGLVQHVKKDLENIETYKAQIHQKVRDAQELIDQVHQNLLDSSDFIINKLSPMR